MISLRGSLLAHLGGWRSDRLSLGDASGLRVLGELGWNPRTQITPQRRILLGPEHLFVLEPLEGPELVPPFRVRRLDLGGKEVDRTEGDPGPGEAALLFRVDPGSGHRHRLRRFGIDIDRGTATVWEGVLELRLRKRPRPFTGTPVPGDGSWWYPLRSEALVRLGGERPLIRRGEPAGAAPVGRDVACAGVRRGRTGLWRDGRWTSLGGPRLFAAGRPPFGRVVAPLAERGAVVLRREGGPLPVHEGPPARLPPGRYSDLAPLPEGLFAVDDAERPQLVPVAF